MRFINTTSLKFEELADSELRDLKNGYSILSHRWTWGDDEILYADVLSMDSDTEAKGGYLKFTGACKLARSLGYDLLWIDTCCINKTDSVELGEAINSMFRWYSIARVCIAYLEDVTSITGIKDSEWFNRGWTLQELIAPKTVNFYDCFWKYLGDKASLSNVVVDRTGIPADVLDHSKPTQAYSIAQRMSWAAKRTTKRLEDRAYSLLGLFNVNMPMIYGEQEKAFIRLQKQIILETPDESIFVWDLDILEDSTRDAREVYCGMLAPSPACFAECGDVVGTGRSQGFRINQFGLNISLPAVLCAKDTYMASLNVVKSEATVYCAIFLALIPGGLFARVSSAAGDSLWRIERPIYPLKEFNVSLEPYHRPSRVCTGFWLREQGFHVPDITGIRILKQRLATNPDYLLLPDGTYGIAGIIRLGLKRNQRSYGWIILGLDSSFRPFCFMCFPDQSYPDTAPGDKDINEMQLEADKLLAFGSSAPDCLGHPVFNVAETLVSKNGVGFGSLAYDSRKRRKADSSDDFQLIIQRPRVLEIAASVGRVPDMRPTASKMDEIWAVDIVTTGSRECDDEEEFGWRCCC